MLASDSLEALHEALVGLVLAACSRNGVPADDVVVIVAPKGRRSAYGWFGPDRWVREPDGRRLHEIVIVAEHLDRDAEAVATTALHEVVHLAAKLRGIRDTSRQHRWHNGRFGELALEFGLQITSPVEPHGVRTTGLQRETFNAYADELAVLADALRLYRSEPLVERTSTGRDNRAKTSPSNGARTAGRGRAVRAVCECEAGGRRQRLISVSAASWERDSIECRVCGSVFAEVAKGAAY